MSRQFSGDESQRRSDTCALVVLVFREAEKKGDHVRSFRRQQEKGHSSTCTRGLTLRRQRAGSSFCWSGVNIRGRANIHTDTDTSGGEAPLLPAARGGRVVCMFVALLVSQARLLTYARARGTTCITMRYKVMCRSNPRTPVSAAGV